MPDKLENPADDKQAERDTPKSRGEERNRNQQQRNRDHRNPDLMRQLIDRVLMRFGIFLDPFIPTLIA